VNSIESLLCTLADRDFMLWGERANFGGVFAEFLTPARNACPIAGCDGSMSTVSRA
jgi:hypothetical protein